MTTYYNLSQLRTEVRHFLNEPTAGFWSDAQLNAYINMGVRKYAEICNVNQTLAVSTGQSITYTSGSRYISGEGFLDIARITAILLKEADKYRPLRKADSFEDIIQLQQTNAYVAADYVWWIEKYFDASGPDDVKIALYVAPIPTSNLSLLTILSGYPDDALQDDDDVAFLPALAKQCVVLYAVYMARTQEENTQGVMLAKQLLDDAEQQLREKLARGLSRGPKMVTYRPID